MVSACSSCLLFIFALLRAARLCDKGSLVKGRHAPFDWLQIVFSAHALLPEFIIAEPILRRVVPQREFGGYAIGLRRAGRNIFSISKPN
ncbi:hypothetical protein AU381_19205 [Sinorhizobium glycinis]|uniref:Uncharacterized protein n=1 Tax=Sinorhizobium glycinis TaxID=1472378 RepID=A0A178XMZ3_9HYPH|nr:hypothetical protein AU381_19205 [Sinorhizobium glycinis]